MAKILALSPRTVEQYIDNLKLKLNCRNKSDLIDAAIQMGFVDIVPSSLFNKNLLASLKL